jgi:selenocysteine lyase/cysteine desulfurase
VTDSTPTRTGLWTPDVSRVALGDRALFPGLDAVAYLGHAAVSPASSEVLRACEAFVADSARRGIGALFAWREQRERLRGRLAALVGAASPGDIAFVANTTSSVVSVASSLPWRRGDVVLCLRGEFPTNVTPWQQAAMTFGLELRFLDADDFRNDRGLETLDQELARGVRLVAVSAVQFSTGLRMPVDTIAARAHAAGAEVFVDAIQACGVVPLDVRAAQIDYLGCGSHKWLMGLEGAAFLYVRPDRAASLVPRLAGWLSHEGAIDFLFRGQGHLRYDRPIRAEASAFETGAPNGIGLAALEAGVAPIEALGVHRIFEHVQRYLDALEPALLERGFKSERSPDASRRSGILSALPPSGLEAAPIARALGERGVVVTTPDGRVRFAPSWPNALVEVPHVVDALDRVLESMAR